MRRRSVSRTRAAAAARVIGCPSRRFRSASRKAVSRCQNDARGTPGTGARHRAHAPSSGKRKRLGLSLRGACSDVAADCQTTRHNHLRQSRRLWNSALVFSWQKFKRWQLVSALAAAPGRRARPITQTPRSRSEPRFRLTAVPIGDLANSLHPESRRIVPCYAR